MEKIIVLGTGAGVCVDYFNACCVLDGGDGDYFLIDTGGGSGVLQQLKRTGIDATKIHNVFISHKHTDHSWGAIWIYRCAGWAMRSGTYDGVLNFYCHDEMAQILRNQVMTLLGKSQRSVLDKRIFINSVNDRERFWVNGYEVEAIDVKPSKDKQFGFKIALKSGKKLAFVGDEPLNEELQEEFRDYDWLLHEALCLESELDSLDPHEDPREVGHGTVATASRMAEKLGIKNLMLWHTREYPDGARKERFIAEAKKYYSGNVYAPDDLDVIEL